MLLAVTLQLLQVLTTECIVHSHPAHINFGLLYLLQYPVLVLALHVIGLLNATLVLGEHSWLGSLQYRYRLAHSKCIFDSEILLNHETIQTLVIIDP